MSIGASGERGVEEREVESGMEKVEQGM